MAPAIPFIGMGLSAIGTGSQIIGGVKRSKAEAEQLRMQNLENRRAAVDTIKEAAEEERNFRVIARKNIGSMRAELSARGVTTEGSGLDILAESARNMELDALAIKKQGQRRAEAFRRGGLAAERASKAASTAGTLGVIGTGLSGASDILGKIPFKRT